LELGGICVFYVRVHVCLHVCLARSSINELIHIIDFSSLASFRSLEATDLEVLTCYELVSLWSPYGIWQTIIFSSCFFFLLFYFLA